MLSRHTGRDDDDVGAADAGIALGAGKAGVETFDRGGLGDVQRLALGQAFDDVEHDDVAKLLEPGQMGQCAADVAAADECEFITRHHVLHKLRAPPGATP